MANKDDKQTKKVDLKNKGLGWIPDYPDLRDYYLEHPNIQKDGELKREKSTDVIENLSENLTKILQVLKSEIPDNPSTSDLERHINKIAKQAFGGIRFINVSLHRFLRKQASTDYSSCVPLGFKRTNETPKQILELKNYLILLVLKGYLDLSNNLKEQYFPDSSDNVNVKNLLDELDSIKFNLATSPTEIVGWLREEDFDDTTRFLVILFQYYSGIQVDGIVGFETYTTLNEYFYKPDNLKKLQDCSGNKKRPEISSPKTRLISIPSLIPVAPFEVIMKELKFRVKEQLEEELRDSNCSSADVERKFFEFELLKNIKMEDEIFDTPIMRECFEKTKAAPKTLLSNLDEILEKSKLSTSENFAQIFSNEFFLVEPVVSFIINIMSPLAHSNSIPLEVVVGDTIEKAKDIFKKAYPKERQSKDAEDKSLSEEVKDILKKVLSEKKQSEDVSDREIELAKEALKKSTQSFKLGIELLLDKKTNNSGCHTKEEDEEINRTLCFYFLFKKWLNRFVHPEEQVKIINERQPNIFDKQELFEVTELLTDQQTMSPSNVQEEQSTSKTNQVELFSTPKLQIPVLNSLITSFESRDLLAEGSPKPYIFLPSVVDLSYWDSTIEDQGSLQSCTAFAGIALIEYFTNRSHGKTTDLSPLFLYKAVRDLMLLNGDVGASVRETIKAMALFGVPPEHYWTYEEHKVDEEPPSFCYSYAQNFQALKYFRLDYADMPAEVLLSQIKAVLAVGFPCMFGFTVYSSAYEDFNIDQGHIPFPSVEKDRVMGGHAVVAIGYNDLRKIPCGDRTGISQGAFLIRNSWGTDWGKEGYGWIPYDYVLSGLTRDWWSLLKSEWFDADSFGLGATNIGNSGDATSQRGGLGLPLGN